MTGDTMAESLIRSIMNGNPNEEAHRIFLRFGAGVFQREKMTIRKGTMIDVSCGFDYLGAMQDVFLERFADEDIEYSGIIIGQNTREIIRIIEDNKIVIIKSTGKKHSVKGEEKGRVLQKAKRELFDASAGFLLSLAKGKNSLKSKTSYPKPGKTVEGFVKMKIEPESYIAIKEALSIKDFKKRIVIETVYDIEKVVFDDALLKKDPARARLESKRDAKIIRTMTIDGKEEKDEMRALI